MANPLEQPFGSATIEVVPQRLADRVVENLVQSILDGKLHPGTELPPESRIAAMFGVSKQVAREAVRQLAAIGLVHVQQGKISRVKAFNAEPLDRFYGLVIRGSEQRLRETNELRRVVETGSAKLAAERRAAEGMAELETAIGGIRDSLADASRFTEADVAFHQAIAKTTGNHMLVLQVEGLRPVMRQVSAILTNRRGRTPAEWTATYQRHLAIFEAIRAGDVEATAAAIDVHFVAADIAADEIFHSGDHK
jgi:GntR family transcriptional repressor for pyruvate dehydrogenase complex